MSDGLTPLTIAGLSAIERDGAPDRTIVFLHGIGGRGTTFAPLFAAFPVGRRLIAWDAPGYGTSPALSHDWPLAADYAERLDALRSALNVDAIDLVAHSLGCLVAGAYTLRRIGRVRKLVLMAPALGYQVPQGASDRLPAGVAARILDIERLGPAGFAEARAPNLVHNAAERPQTVAFVRGAMSAIDSRGYAQAARMLGSGDLLADAAALARPTIIINGADDKVTPLAGAQRLAAAFPENFRPHVHVIESAGHAVSIEQPETIAALISSFLEAP